jgi:hypothetical protein
MSFQPLRALISLIAALASLYVIYGTLGTALMVFKIQAINYLTHATLSVAWSGIATTAANNFDYWFSSIWVIGVALIVYTFLSAVSSTVYDRPYP